MIQEYNEIELIIFLTEGFGAKKGIRNFGLKFNIAKQLQILHAHLFWFIKQMLLGKPMFVAYIRSQNHSKIKQKKRQEIV